MTQETSIARIDTELRLTPEAIHRIKSDIMLLSEMTKEVLVKDIDYGRIPGTPADSLWDPGASKIIAAFNSYVGPRRLLHFKDDGKAIAAIIEVTIIHRNSRLEVGSGVGAASTYETKYKYRWVQDPREWGYNDEAIKGLKIRKGERSVTEYRIRNPEHDELLNTIIKMSSKRAETDAAEALPGVATALRALFTGKPLKGGAKEKLNWNWFWGEATRMGLTEAEAHTILNVKSMSQLTAQGWTLEEIIEELRRLLAEQHPAPKEKEHTPVADQGEAYAVEEANRGKYIAELTDIFDQLAWLPGTKEEWCLQHVGYRKIEEMPTPIIAQAVDKAKKLLRRGD